MEEMNFESNCFECLVFTKSIEFHNKITTAPEILILVSSATLIEDQKEAMMFDSVYSMGLLKLFSTFSLLNKVLAPF